MNALEQFVAPVERIDIPSGRARIVTAALARTFCAPLIVRGDVPDGPVVFVANHSSHADTAALIAALGSARGTVHPAAAEDYFFRTSALGRITRALTGAFPFPRHGGAGLARARGLLEQGHSVVLFPEGTRGRDGRIAAFKPGAGMLAAEGYTVVPVAIAGTANVLPVGSRLPRRAPVAIWVGAPLSLTGRPTGEATASIERVVRALHARASLARPARVQTVVERARRFAMSPAALVLAFAWGCAESIAWPIVPDLLIALVALAAPRRFLSLAGAALAGSLGGGAVAYGAGMLWPTGVDHLPLISGRMADAASGWMTTEGARGVWHQPWSGVPFKAFTWQAHGSGVGLVGLLGQTIVARGHRFLLVAVVAGGFGRITRGRGYAFLAACVVTFFLAGLRSVVQAWA